MSRNIVFQDTTESLFLSEAQLVNARELMQRGVVSIENLAPVYSAATLIVEKQISGLPVTYKGQLVGILSEKDLLRLLYENQQLPGIVEDYMTRDVVSFGVEDSVFKICHYLVKHDFRRVPIMNGPVVTGIITRADLIKFYRRQIQIANPIETETVSSEVFADDIMHCGLLTVRPHTLLTTAMDLIVKHRVTGLPVVDRNMTLLGIITEKDILLHICDTSRTETETQDIMTRDVVCFSPKAHIAEICNCLIQHDFHRVPIVDQGQLLGIISRSDILRYLCSVYKR